MRYVRPDPDEPLSSEERITLAALAVEGSANLQNGPELVHYRLRDRDLIRLYPLGRHWPPPGWRVEIRPAGREALEE